MEHVPLSAKVDIARKLAQWLLHLHAVRWLHKSIRSASVVFFSEQGSRDLGNPFVTGFDYARSVVSTATTTKPPESSPWLLYVHPDYLGPKRGLGYRKIYDIYSLGVVFIELACWSSIVQIVDAAEVAEQEVRFTEAHALAGAAINGAQKANLAVPNALGITVDNVAMIRRNILNGRWNVLERVRSLAGDKYHDVVKACLVGTKAFGVPEYARETDNNASADLLEAFHKIVIEPLKDINV